MLVRSQVKYIQTLGHKKFRDADGVFVAEGPKIVNELLVADNIRLVHCFATKKWVQSNIKHLTALEDKIVKTEEKELERISFLTTPNQVLAIFTKPAFKKRENPPGITLLLDTIQDPGNLGTIIRTADWFGVQRIVCSMETVDLFNSKVVQSAMGSLIRVEIIYSDLADYISAHPDTPVYASSLKGVDLYEQIQTSKVILLLGNESKGISPELECLATRSLRIPCNGGAESLNVAVAAGILLSRFQIL